MQRGGRRRRRRRKVVSRTRQGFGELRLKIQQLTVLADFNFSYFPKGFSGHKKPTRSGETLKLSSHRVSCSGGENPLKSSS